jgi:hypothetical protein
VPLAFGAVATRRAGEGDCRKGEPEFFQHCLFPDRRRSRQRPPKTIGHA